MFLNFKERNYEFPTRIFLPSGNDVVVKNLKEGQDFAESLRKRYEEVLKASKTPEDKMVAQEFYDDYLKLSKDLQHIKNSYHLIERKEAPEPTYEGLAKFPMRFTAPSGAVYTLNNFNDFKKFKDENFWKGELAARSSSKEYPTTREKLMKDADADYRYLMGEREKLLTKGWENKGKDKYWFKRGTKEQNEEREKQYKDMLRRTWGIATGKPKPPAPTTTQEQGAASQPPEETAQPPQPLQRKAKKPFQVDEQTLNAALLSRVMDDENLDEYTKQFWTKLIGKMDKEGGYQNTYDKVKNYYTNKYQEDDETPEEVKKSVLDAINNFSAYRDETLANIMAQNEAESGKYDTPHEEDEEGIYNTEQNVGVDPETLTRLGIQAESKRLARRPFKPNPYATEEPISEMEQESIDTFNRLSNEANLPREKGEQHETIQKLLKDYIDPSVMDQRAETLKDMLISKVRERAQQRLMKSYEKLGMKLSAAGMGRSGYEEKMRQEMAKEMEIELAEREFVEGMRIRQQEEENQRARLNTALQAYILNQKEEEARKVEQTRAATNKLAAAKYAAERIQRAKDRQAEEFTREQEHPWRAQNQLADIINKTTRGEAKPVEPSLDEIKRPEVVPQAAPAAVEREIGPTHVPPAIGHAPERDTTFADTTAAGLGLGKLVLDAYNTFGGGSKKEEAKA